jgi:hypothetical protein
VNDGNAEDRLNVPAEGEAEITVDEEPVAIADEPEVAGAEEPEVDEFDIDDLFGDDEPAAGVGNTRIH